MYSSPNILETYFIIHEYFRFQEKNSKQNWDSNPEICSLAVNHFSYPDSINSMLILNLSLENNAKQGVLVCDTICHQSTEITFLYFLILISKVKLICGNKIVIFPL